MLVAYPWAAPTVARARRQVSLGFRIAAALARPMLSANQVLLWDLLARTNTRLRGRELRPPVRALTDIGNVGREAEHRQELLDAVVGEPREDLLAGAVRVPGGHRACKRLQILPRGLDQGEATRRPVSGVDGSASMLLGELLELVEAREPPVEVVLLQVEMGPVVDQIASHDGLAVGEVQAGVMLALAGTELDDFEAAPAER